MQVKENETMKVGVIGANGQLGTDLIAVLADRGVPLTHNDIEITDPSSIETVLTQLNPDVVINAAAYNFVDRAEDEPEAAYEVNALGARNLAIACQMLSIRFVHVSSDYVFGGCASADRPFVESDLVLPNSAYAVSKLAGEYFVRSNCEKHFVVRTCGLYGYAAMGGRGKGNFVETMLRLGAERDELSIVDDQRCTPTVTTDLAQSIVSLIETEAYGLYHATNGGNTTWKEFAEEIFRLADLTVNVIPITTEQFGAKANRPRYSVLDCAKLHAGTGFEFPSWQDALRQYIQGRSNAE